jgi:hypothetical protein
VRLLACACAALGVLVPAVVVGPFDAGLVPALLVAIPAAAAFAGLGRHSGVVRGQPEHESPEHDGQNFPERHGAAGVEER